VRTSSSSPSSSSSSLSPVRSISTRRFDLRAPASLAGDSVAARFDPRSFEAGVKVAAGRDEGAGDLAGLRKGEGEIRREDSLTGRFFGVGSLQSTIRHRQYSYLIRTTERENTH
jgi:hypothetical protein